MLRLGGILNWERWELMRKLRKFFQTWGKLLAILLAVVMVSTIMVVAPGGGDRRADQDIVAVVNGDEITWAELESRASQMKMMYEMQGEAVTPEMEDRIREMVLDNMIDEILLLQEALRQGFDVTEEEIDEAYEDIVARYDSEEELKSLLHEDGMTVEDLRDQIREQLIIMGYIDEYVEQELGEEGLEVTEEDVRELYERYSAQMEDFPEYDEVESYLREELEDQRYYDAISQLVADLREASTINYNP